MKQFFLVVLVLCSLHALAQPGGDLAAEGIRGPVKMVTELQYYEGFRTPAMKTVDKYDARGNLVEEIHNDYVLKLNTRKYIKYDTTVTGVISARNEYDDSARLIRAVVYTYDGQFRLIEFADHRNFGDKKAVYKNEYGYDSTGRKVKEKIYANDVLNYTTTFSHDNKGRVSATKSHDKDDKMVMFYDYNYLADTQWVHCEKQVGEVRTHIFRIIDSAGVILEKTTYVGDYSKQVTESYSGFDNYGNWLKQSVKGPATGNYVLTRAIEYYK